MRLPDWLMVPNLLALLGITILVSVLLPLLVLRLLNKSYYLAYWRYSESQGRFNAREFFRFFAIVSATLIGVTVFVAVLLALAR